MPNIRITQLAAAVSFVCARRRKCIDDIGLTALAVASLWGTAATAQQPTQGAEAPEEITITGSRLRRDGMSTSTVEEVKAYQRIPDCRATI